MKNLLALLVIVIVVLIGFGARPGDLLHIPLQVLNSIMSKKPGTAGNEEPPAPSQPVASPPVAQPSPPPGKTALPAVAEMMAPSATAAPLLTPPPTDTDIDLAVLSKTPSQWPKFVTLKKTEVFPAVLDGRVIGTVKTQPGAHAHVMLIRSGKVGVEYQGGGAMVDVTETDLIEQVLASRHSAR